MLKCAKNLRSVSHDILSRRESKCVVYYFGALLGLGKGDTEKEENHNSNVTNVTMMPWQGLLLGRTAHGI